MVNHKQENDGVAQFGEETWTKLVKLISESSLEDHSKRLILAQVQILQAKEKYEKTLADSVIQGMRSLIEKREKEINDLRQKMSTSFLVKLRSFLKGLAI